MGRQKDRPLPWKGRRRLRRWRRKAEHQLRDPQGPFPPDFSSGRHVPESSPYLRRSHPSLLACRNALAICAGVWSVTKFGSGPDARSGTLKKPSASSSHQAMPSSRQGSMRTAGQPTCSGMKNMTSSNEFRISRLSCAVKVPRTPIQVHCL